MAVLKYKKQDGSYATLTNISIKGIEPVQVTGNSTTDVMSQNAVTTYLNTKADTATTYTKEDANSTFLSKTDASNTYVAKTAGVTGGSYDSNSKLITLYHADGTTASTIDCTDFIKDGMVDNVAVSGGNLNIIFNTDAGKEQISIAISEIFDATNYYTKSDLTGSSTTVVVTKANSANTASTVALAGVTGLQTALDNKADYSGLTAHTSDSTIHVTSTDKASWNDAVALKHSHTNQTVLDGISSENVTSWNSAYNAMHSHSNMSVISGISQSDINTWNAVTSKANQSDLTVHTANSTVHITATERTNWNSAYGTTSGITATTAAINSLTGSVGTMAFANAANYSSATEVNTALGTGFTVSSVTDVIESNERVVAASINDLNANKADKATTLAGYGITDAISSVTTSSTNGNISVNGSNVAVHGLGGAAYLNTGTTAGTVAAGDHTHSQYITAITSGDVTSALGYTPTQVTYTSVTLSSNLTNVTCPVTLVNDGDQCNVLYINSNADHTISVSTNYKTADNQQINLTVKANGYAEVNYMKFGNDIYVRGV